MTETVTILCAGGKTITDLPQTVELFIPGLRVSSGIVKTWNVVASVTLFSASLLGAPKLSVLAGKATY